MNRYSPQFPWPASRGLPGRGENHESEIVREAILDYSERSDRLGERERLRMLRAFDALVPQIPTRPIAEVDAELDAVRESRRLGGRAEGGKG